jgi:hypothetical protein
MQASSQKCQTWQGFRHEIPLLYAPGVSATDRSPC